MATVPAVCTVLLRFAPGSDWPLVLGAVRDEFVERSWDGPDRHWGGGRAHLVGGLDRTAGGTWLAVDPDAPAVACLVNGAVPCDEDGQPILPAPVADRPTRGDLALRILTEGTLPDDVERYARFHLLRARPDGVDLWSWDEEALVERRLAPGAHIVVNAGVDTDDDPLVPHFRPLVERLDADPAGWLRLLEGDGLALDDERALVLRTTVHGRAYGSTSASFVRLAPGQADYRFTGDPQAPRWQQVVG